MNSSTCSSFLQTTTVRMDGILRHPHFTTPPAFYAPSKTALTIQGDLHILLLGTKHYTYSFTHTSYTAISLHLYTNCYAVYMNLHVPATSLRTGISRPNEYTAPWKLQGKKFHLSAASSSKHTSIFLALRNEQAPTPQKPPEMPSDAANALQS